MKKINCLIVPIPNNEELPTDYLKLLFPETERTIAELVDINDPEISTSIGSNHELIRHTDDPCPFKITEEYPVNSFQTALDHFHLIVHR